MAATNGKAIDGEHRTGHRRQPAPSAGVHPGTAGPRPTKVYAAARKTLTASRATIREWYR